jgi:hypothetical protein
MYYNCDKLGPFLSLKRSSLAKGLQDLNWEPTKISLNQLKIGLGNMPRNVRQWTARSLNKNAPIPMKRERDDSERSTENVLWDSHDDFDLDEFDTLI